MLFNELTIRRVCDGMEINYISTGDYAHIYEAPYDIIHRMKEESKK
jgi:hypothetical protein